MPSDSTSTQTPHSELNATPNTSKTAPPPMRAASEYPSRPSSRPPQATSFSTDLEPQQSRLGLYITVGVIGVLVILLLYQVFSKSGLSAEVRQLKSENAALQEQISALENTQQTNTSTVISSGNSLFYPAMYRNNIRQQIGQLVPISADSTLTAVYLVGNGGTGDNAELAIYETTNPTNISESQRPTVSKLFNASKIPVGQKFAVQLDKPQTLKAGKSYLFVIRPSSSNAQANIGYVNSDVIGGSMWVYAMRVNPQGVALDSKPSWQQIPTSDMQLELKTQ